MKENERFYGFTEFRGKAVGRGRDGHGSENQINAGLEVESGLATVEYSIY